MKKVLNTMIQQTVATPARLKTLFWGIALTKDPLDRAGVIALDGAGTTVTPGGLVENGRENRYDRYKTYYNFDMENLDPLGEGKYIVICIPTDFGGVGKFQFNSMVNNFVLVNTIAEFLDEQGLTYGMNVFMSYNRYYGYVDELITI